MGEDKSERRPNMHDADLAKTGGLGKVQTVCVLVAIGLMVIGGALWAIGPAWGDNGVQPGGGRRPNGDLATAIAPDGSPPVGLTERDSPTINKLSPAIFGVGFSFAVGFAIAFAARTFSRLTLIAIGVFLLASFGLEYADIITVNWDKIQGHYDSFAASTRESFGGFGEFITGRLPSAASALAGLVIGFRRR